MKKQKFDDWSDVKDCNDCECWWVNQCDGLPTGVERTCTAFKATRRVNIPEEIKSLRKALKGICWACIMLAVGVILHIVSGWF